MWSVYLAAGRVVEIANALLDVLEAVHASQCWSIIGAVGGAGGTTLAIELATALAARRDGQPPRLGGTPGKVTSTLPGNDLRAEAARLILVARAFRCSPIVARIAGQAGGAAEPAERLATGATPAASPEITLNI